MGYLEEMIDRRRATVKEFVKGFSGERLKNQLEHVDEPKQVLQLIAGSKQVLVIPEFRRAVPGSGPIALYADPSQVAADFQDGGAALVSCCVEPEDSRGSFDDLGAVAEATDLPLIARDLTVTSEQLALFRAFGADAATIVAGQVGDKLLSFIKLCIHMGLTPVVEVHNAQELIDTARTGAPLAIVEAIDYQDFSVSKEATLRLANAAKEAGLLVIVAGCITDRADVEAAAAAGADAVLVGEPVMLAGDAAEAVEALSGVARRRAPHHTSVEVQGVTTVDQAQAAASAGADAVAVELTTGTSRQISPEQAAAIFNELDPNVRRIGVFGSYDLDAIHRAMNVAGLDSVQLHGEATPEQAAQIGRPTIRAVTVGPEGKLDLAALSAYGEPVVSFLVEAPRETAWEQLVLPDESLCIISADFTEKSVGPAVAALEPAAVVLKLAADEDVQGVEAFVAAVRTADEQLNARG